MELALVVAIVRFEVLKATERKLKDIGVRGITIIRAKGYGEHAVAHDILAREWTADQAKIEIYAARDHAERIAAAIIDAAHTGWPGDGIVAILPVHRVLSVRSRSVTIPNG